MTIHHRFCRVPKRTIDKLPRIRGDPAGEGNVTSSRTEAGDENGAPPDRQPFGHLCRGPSRETVYIADSKETYETCRTDVAEVH